MKPITPARINVRLAGNALLTTALLMNPAVEVGSLASIPWMLALSLSVSGVLFFLFLLLGPERIAAILEDRL